MGRISFLSSIWFSGGFAVVCASACVFLQDERGWSEEKDGWG